MTPTPRNFQQEFNAFLESKQLSEYNFFDGCTEIIDLMDVLVQVRKRMETRTITEFRIDLMIQALALFNAQETSTDLYSFSTFINEVPKMTAKDMGYDIEDFVVKQSDALKIIANFNDVISPLKQKLADEIKEHNAEIEAKQAKHIASNGGSKLKSNGTKKG